MTEPNTEKYFDNQLAVKSIDAKSRTVHAIFSTDAIDSHGERVHQSFKLDRFNSNPVVLWFHNRAGNGLPIGKAHNVAVRGGKLEGSVTFAEHAFAEEVWGLYRDGFLKAFSIGFRPGKVTEEKVNGEDVFVLRDNELFEISAVPIPSNEQSLVKMKAMNLGHICPIWRKEQPAAPAPIGHAKIADRLDGKASSAPPAIQTRDSRIATQRAAQSARAHVFELPAATASKAHPSARVEAQRADERVRSIGHVRGKTPASIASRLGDGPKGAA